MNVTEIHVLFQIPQTQEVEELEKLLVLPPDPGLATVQQ
jgi:hypothetical protein